MKENCIEYHYVYDMTVLEDAQYYLIQNYSVHNLYASGNWYVTWNLSATEIRKAFS